MSVTHDAEVETGIVGTDNRDAMLCNVRAKRFDNLRPWSELDLATLQHASIVSEQLASIESAHHGFSIGENFLHKPIALENGLAALIANHIADVIDRPSEVRGFSVKNQKSVFHYAAPPSASLIDRAS